MRSVRFRGDSKRLRAAEINRWNAIANQHARGELRQLRPPRLNSLDPNSRVALCKNTTGQDRAAFDCMAIEDLLWDLETDGTADIVFNLSAAAADKQPAILIEPIAAGEFGRAVLDGLAIAKVAGGTGQRATIQAANNRLVPGESGSIILLQTPHASEERLLPVVLNSPTVKTPKTPATVRLQFRGVDPTNAFNWGDTNANAYTNYSNLWAVGPGSPWDNIPFTITTVPASGISIVPEGGASPANAELLQLANPGIYHLDLMWRQAINVEGIPYISHTNVHFVSAGGPERQFGVGMPGYTGNPGQASGIPWLHDQRVINVTAPNTLVWVKVFVQRPPGGPSTNEHGILTIRTPPI